MAAAGKGVGRDVGEIYSSSTFLARADKRQQQHGISEVFPDFEFFRSLVFKTLNCWRINAFDSIFFEIFQSSLVSSKFLEHSETDGNSRYFSAMLSKDFSYLL